MLPKKLSEMVRTLCDAAAKEHCCVVGCKMWIRTSTAESFCISLIHSCQSVHTVIYLLISISILR